MHVYYGDGGGDGDIGGGYVVFDGLRRIFGVFSLGKLVSLILSKVSPVPAVISLP